MKILLLADPSSTHTIKWANSLAQKGLNIFLFGLSTCGNENIDRHISVISNPGYSWFKKHKDGSLIKVTYLTSYFNLKKKFREIKPDILHAHYASSYGLLGSLMNFHPYILSIWGNDITEFPRKSYLHKLVIKRILKKTDILTATSSYLKEKTLLYTNKNISIIPFGIDTNKFKKSNYANPEKKEGDILIGIFKSLENHYGIDLLIKAIKKLTVKIKMSVKLLIIGGGSLEFEFKRLVNELDLSEKVIFTGKINHDQIVQYHNMVDIAVYPSIRESFGVSVLESSACEVPVIVSDVGGLTEVALNNKTGIVVKSGNIDMIVEALEKLILNPSLREQYGNQGRKFVQQNYNWDMNVNQMINIYEELLRKDL